MGSPAVAAETPVERNGIHLSMPRETYDLIKRVNFSTAKDIAKSPEHYSYALANAGSIQPDTAARKTGRITHLAVFEPELFRDKVVTCDLNRNSNDFKAFLADATANGCEVVKDDAYLLCGTIANAVRRHPLAGQYTRGGNGEVTVLWTHEAPAVLGLPGYALDCKARLDYLAADFIADLKVVRDASPEGFGKACASYKTYTQAAIYADAVWRVTGKHLPYYLLAVESSPPFVVQPYEVIDPIMDMGRAEYREWFDAINACRESRRYPGYADGVLPLELPRWAMPSDDETDLSEAGLIFPEEE